VFVFNTKRTSSSSSPSHRSVTCSRHDIADKLVFNNNHTLTYINCVSLFSLHALYRRFKVYVKGIAKYIYILCTDHPPFSNFLFTNLFSIQFLYFFIISSLLSYFNLFVSIFIQSHVNIKLHVSTLYI
jgi:hypothetical protein